MTDTAPARLPTDYAAWTLRHAQQAVADAIARMPGGKAAFDMNRAIVENQDYWRNGEGWAGPTGTPATKAKVLEMVRPMFTPVDSVGEILTNVSNGLLQLQADITFTPVGEPPKPESNEAKAQQKEIDAMLAAVSRWWDDKKLWDKARRSVRRSRAYLRGLLWVLIPASELERDAEASADAEPVVGRLPQGLDLAAALDKIELVDLTPDVAVVFTHPETQQRAAIILTKAGNRDAAELWYRDVGPEGQARTLVRILTQRARGASQPLEIGIGGRLPLAQMEAELLITEPVRKQADALNHFETVLSYVVTAGGFPERTITNAKPNGIWMETPPTDAPALDVREEGGRKWYLHGVPRMLGALIINDLYGLDLPSKDGTPEGDITTPGVIYKEPTDTQFIINAAAHRKETLYRDAKQGHLALTSTAEASGTAYEQARAPHLADLAKSKAPTEGMLADTIEAAIALAGTMAKDPAVKSFLERYRCTVTVRINPGPITADEQRSITERVQAGQLSIETGMAMQGVEDVPAERARHLASDEGRLALLLKRLEVVKAATDDGAGLPAAAKLAGFSDDEIKVLISTDVLQRVNAA